MVISKNWPESKTKLPCGLKLIQIPDIHGIEM